MYDVNLFACFCFLRNGQHLEIVSSRGFSLSNCCVLGGSKHITFSCYGGIFFARSMEQSCAYGSIYDWISIRRIVLRRGGSLFWLCFEVQLFCIIF